MTPVEVVERLASLGINITRKTLLRYEHEGLIPKATFRNSRTTDYPEDVVGYAYAVWRIIHDTKFKDKSVIAKVVSMNISAAAATTDEEFRSVSRNTINILDNNEMLAGIFGRFTFFLFCKNCQIPANTKLVMVTIEKDEILKWLDNKETILALDEKISIISGDCDFSTPKRGDTVYFQVCDLLTTFIVFDRDAPGWQANDFQFLVDNAEAVRQHIVDIADYIATSLNNDFKLDEKTKKNVQDLLDLIDKAV